MNKYLSSSLIIFSIIFSQQAISLCDCNDPGDQLITVTQSYGSCPVSITYCYKYFPSPSASSMALEICDISFPLSTECGNISMNDPAFWAWTKQTVMNNIGNDIPPCDPNEPNDGAIVVEVFMATCWLATSNTSTQTSYLSPCSEYQEGKCQTIYRACWDGSDLQITTIQTPQIIDAGGCNYYTEYTTFDEMVIISECFNSCW